MKKLFMVTLAGLVIAPTLWLTALADELIRINDDFYVSDGQPDEAQIRDFARRGGRHVIDLRRPTETPGFDEATVVTQAGMNYHNIPIAGAAGLTRENVERLDQLLNRLKGETTLLHCASGNRVGALMPLRARWLHDASIDEALDIGRKHGLAGLQPEVEMLLRTH